MPRDRDGEAGAPQGAWIHRNRSFMGLDDAISDGQTKSSSRPDGLGGKERFEDAFSQFSWNSRTCIADLDGIGCLVVCSFNVYATGALDRIGGISDDVHDHLVQKGRGAIEVWDGVVMAAHVDPGAELMA